MNTIDNIMALADGYANSYMTFHEKGMRKALLTALTELVSKMDIEHKVERDILIHRIKDIKEELVISKSSVISMENNQTRMQTERREALEMAADTCDSTMYIEGDGKISKYGPMTHANVEIQKCADAIRALTKEIK